MGLKLFLPNEILFTKEYKNFINLFSGTKKRAFRWQRSFLSKNNSKVNHEKIFDLLQEIERDLKNYELELRIEELESKFAQDFSENTFNEIKELKKLQKIN